MSVSESDHFLNLLHLRDYIHILEYLFAECAEFNKIIFKRRKAAFHQVEGLTWYLFHNLVYVLHQEIYRNLLNYEASGYF